MNIYKLLKGNSFSSFSSDGAHIHQHHANRHHQHTVSDLHHGPNLWDQSLEELTGQAETR